jgi:hypothetical protein
LYETTKEKGEDLVDAAHPKGSHKLEGVDGDATVETILDQHSKIVDIINKKPTGKLASSRDIINAVKKAFGSRLTNIYTQGKNEMIQALTTAKQAVTDFSQVPNLGQRYPTMNSFGAEIDKSLAAFQNFDVNEEPDLKKGGAFDSAKSAIDKCIREVNATSEEASRVKFEGHSGNSANSFQKDESGNFVHKRDPKDAAWWAKLDKVSTSLKIALNLTNKALHHFQGEQDNQGSEVLQKDIYVQLNRLSNGLRLIKNEFDALDFSKLSTMSKEDQTYVNTYKVDLSSVTNKATEVAGKFAVYTEGKTENDATFFMNYLAPYFSGTSLQKDMAAVGDIASLKAKVNELLTDYENTLDTDVKPALGLK